MNKITAIWLLYCLCFQASGQHCAINRININPVAASVPGFLPSPAALACSVVDSFTQDTLYFRNYDTIYFGSYAVSIDSVRFDSISNLPPGLCWASSSASNTIAGGSSGSFLIQGIAGGPPGQYKAKIIVDAWTNFGLFSNQDAESLVGLRYYFRLRCAQDSCRSVDSINGMSRSFIAYTACPGPPDAVISPSGSDTICPGDTITLTVSWGPGYRCRWSNGDTVRSISVATPGQYWVTTYNAYDSAVSLPVQVLFSVLPDTAIGLSGPVSICLGDSLTLTAAAGSGYNYEWSSFSAYRSITVKTAGTYTCTITNSMGCSVVAGPVTTTILPLPEDSIYYNNGQLFSQYQFSYYWYRGDALLNNDTSISIGVTQNGTYQVLVTDSNGCKAFSNSITINNESLNMLEDRSILQIWPNPCDGLCHINAETALGKNIEIFDAGGRLIRKIGLEKSSNLFDFRDLQEGSYLIRINRIAAGLIIKR